MTTSMSKLTTSLIREPALQIGETMTTSIKNVEKQQQQKQQQQQLPKEVFSPQITKFKRERIIPLYKDETWSVDLIDNSSLSKYNKIYKFILTVIDIFTKYAWAIPLKNKSGLTITNGFKIILGEHPQGGSEHQHSCGFPDRKPKKLWVDRGSEFYKKTFKYLLKQYETKLFLLIVI